MHVAAGVKDLMKCLCIVLGNIPIYIQTHRKISKEVETKVNTTINKHIM
jgi:hypothetical protein